MERIAYPHEIDLSKFQKKAPVSDVRYGLPEEVLFCKKCVISNQRPNSAVEYKNHAQAKKKTIHFDEHGVCDACRFAERKQQIIDWGLREKQLKELCDRHRSHDGSYDCLVPGSGGKDSFYASHILKTKYGMHPLTVTWAPHLYTDWGQKNFQSWIHAGHDNYLMTPNGRVHRLLTRLSTELLFHPFQPFMIGQKALAPKLSLLFDIPLIFYGENEAEYGNPIADTDKAQRDPSYFAMETQDDVCLGGVRVADLKERFGLTQHDLHPYLPADPNKLRDKKTEVHYLGYYLKWHPQSCYYYAVEHGGFEASPERTPGTYSKYNSIDDKIDDFHFYTTGAKFGLGRASYDAAQEIRSGDILREEGAALVKRFDHEYPERFEDEIFKYLSLPEDEFPEASSMFEVSKMSREYFKNLTNQFRSPHLWYHEGGIWKLRHAVWEKHIKSGHHEEVTSDCTA
jgi:N-acetyl sugar amidotransferase